MEVIELTTLLRNESMLKLRWVRKHDVWARAQEKCQSWVIGVVSHTHDSTWEGQYIYRRSNSYQQLVPEVKEGGRGEVREKRGDLRTWCSLSVREKDLLQWRVLIFLSRLRRVWELRGRDWMVRRPPGKSTSLGSLFNGQSGSEPGFRSLFQGGLGSESKP